ncbi:N-acetyldiaminopimelate deacetylase [Salisediminibacterium selenitireducens]|uniref:Amidohydrolase n=1 Tax=Bacillus selenitireducens (strain ATCC 700615 / DSM 15326 / MLS10) TaxID=439292 RepID=D6XTG8_BACIE|nr:N-acetyldiaminopimelate deacetylase [Salisediminibacterium selenitireducens]ADH99104.1 amidohydrolase [[Bacillus] selenitireducens MLS10]
MDTVNFFERLVKNRRALHQIPEPGFKEEKTQLFLMAKLKDLDPDGRLVIKKWRTGLFVKIPGQAPVKTIGYRADIDGLPIDEETGFDYQSTHHGMMHACGHDFHMTIALGIVEKVMTAKLKNDVVIIFQPAEEGPGGALPILGSEDFAPFRPDEIYSLHVAPELPVGVISTKPGTLFANTSELFIDLKGKGGHAAYPHLTDDMAVAASYLVTQLQTIVSRNISPADAAVLTIGKMTAGTKQNIIAESARIEGTIRTLSDESMSEIRRRIEGMIKGIEASFQCQVTVDYGSSYCQVYNDRELAESFMDFMASDSSVVFQKADTAMTGEDFGYFLREIPGVMCWLGVDSQSGLHTPTLSPDERALEVGVKAFDEWIRYRDQLTESE